MLWTVIGITAAVLTMLGFVPQTVKMWKTRSVKDVSGITLVQFGIGITLWIFYGTHIGDWIIIGANAISLVIVLITLALFLKWKKLNR
jgi:MtN3 and saliva related transmembrane protein